ncbi:TonB-dependent siderophore receptor [Thiomicrorhabdus sp.]|uniref:TonB-dependent receptor n=1 Tax=Thiomicrorhabdus sp. TaxID=2039724 RepID=UPI0029C90BE5|nr:TonB-dependent siderophore receptor [Thiomicrorhabdus sp.]
MTDQINSGLLKPLSLRSNSSFPKNRHLAKGALAIGVSSLMTPMAMAEEVINLDTLQVEERTIDTNPYAEPGAPYKARISGDQRHVKPIAETPQTISVLTQTQIEDSGKSDLKEILAAQPGITLGTGENGNAFGDRYIIRGHEARSDVFVDGLKDPGMTIRESFATEQIEISKGPSSTFAGRGTTGGAVNSVTKQANSEYSFTKLQGGIGTDGYHRYTLDSNQKISDDFAVRLNLLDHREGVPDRDPAERQRQGFALSGVYEASDKLKIIADIYHLEANDKPDLGGYIQNNEPHGDVPVYLQDQDFLKSTINTATLRLEYEINDSVRLHNAMRYGTTENGYVVTGARGTTTDASDPNGSYDTISLSTHQGWQDVSYFVDQLNLYVDHSSGDIDHKMIFGAEFSDMKVKNGVYDVTNTGATNCIVSGRGGLSNGYCAVDASGNVVANLNGLMGRSISKGDFDSDYNIVTTSLYAMDTADVTDKFSVFAGIRFDHFDYKNTIQRSGVQTPYSYSDNLWNGHVGIVYDLTDEGNIYASYSTAANINGGESDVGTSSGYGGLVTYNGTVAGADPEITESYEIGTKWNLFDGKLLATAALFRITKSDVMEGADYDSIGTFNTGKNQVEGIELGLSGNLTEKLSTQAGVTFMNSEILKSATAANVGKRLSNFADNSAYVQMRYQTTPKLAIGGSMTYRSEMYAGQPDTAAGYNSTTGEYSVKIPAYTVYDLFATYEFNRKLDARINVGNVTNETYYLAAYRSGSFAYLGDARNVKLTLNYEF